MKNHKLKLVFVAMLVGLSFAALQCSNKSPLSPETQDSIGPEGFLKLDMKLPKLVTQAIDSVTVEARRPQTPPVRARLKIVGKQARGSLKVSPGEGWVVTAEVYIGAIVYYSGQSRPIAIAAGQTVPVNIVVQALMDLVASRVYIADLDWNELSYVEEGQEVLLVLVYENTGSGDAVGWREEAYIDGGFAGSTDDISLGAGQTKQVGQKWVAVVGTHTIEYRLDTGGVVPETDETNNTVSLTFTVSPARKGIVAGRSVDGVEIGFTEAQVIEKLGNPSEIDMDGNFTYDSGIMVVFDESGWVSMIMVMLPYSGTTERGIGLGSAAYDIIGQYGIDYIEIPVLGFPAYWYGGLGIAFILDENSICFMIAIFSPSAAKATLSYPDTMERLQRYVFSARR